MFKIDLIRHRIVRIYQSYFPKKLTETEHALVQEMLDNKLQALFYEQPLCDQRHGLLVFKKAKELFGASEHAPSEYEIFVASCFHDVAKKDARLGVTQRIIAASLMGLLPKAKLSEMESSSIGIFRRIWIYADHSELSWRLLEPHIQSDFVQYATLCHHGLELPDAYGSQLSDQIDIFIEADTL